MTRLIKVDLIVWINNPRVWRVKRYIQNTSVSCDLYTTLRCSIYPTWLHCSPLRFFLFSKSVLIRSRPRHHLAYLFV
jgi:hypothetical protein